MTKLMRTLFSIQLAFGLVACATTPERAVERTRDFLQSLEQPIATRDSKEVRRLADEMRAKGFRYIYLSNQSAYHFDEFISDVLRSIGTLRSCDKWLEEDVKTGENKEWRHCLPNGRFLEGYHDLPYKYNETVIKASFIQRTDLLEASEQKRKQEAKRKKAEADAKEAYEEQQRLAKQKAEQELMASPEGDKIRACENVQAVENKTSDLKQMSDSLEAAGLSNVQIAQNLQGVFNLRSMFVRRSLAAAKKYSERTKLKFDPFTECAVAKQLSQESRTIVDLIKKGAID